MQPHAAQCDTAPVHRHAGLHAKRGLNLPSTMLIRCLSLVRTHAHRCFHHRLLYSAKFQTNHLQLGQATALINTGAATAPGHRSSRNERCVQGKGHGRAPKGGKSIMCVIPILISAKLELISPKSRDCVHAFSHNLRALPPAISMPRYGIQSTRKLRGCRHLRPPSRGCRRGDHGDEWAREVIVGISRHARGDGKHAGAQQAFHLVFACSQ